MLEIFEKLKVRFNENGYRLYMIGSTSRDYLINNQILDYDFVSDATPNEIEKFLKVDKTFSKYGITTLKLNGYKIQIATLRKEGEYLDSRHPSSIEFIKDINVDYLRRDFTINAIYIDENYKIIDPSGGVIDLKNRVLRFIGDPLTRIKEDPLRILRAKRFIKEYNLSASKEVLDLLDSNMALLEKLNKEKVKEELKKGEKIHEN